MSAPDWELILQHIGQIVQAVMAIAAIFIDKSARKEEK